MLMRRVATPGVTQTPIGVEGGLSGGDVIPSSDSRPTAVTRGWKCAPLAERSFLLSLFFPTMGTLSALPGESLMGLRILAKSSVYPLGLLAFVFLLACGDDAKPPQDTTIDVPGDVATLGEAIDLAENGGRIHISSDTLSLDTAIQIEDLQGLEIFGRENSAQQRPVLLAELPGRTVLDIASTSGACTIRGLVIAGRFTTGIRVRSAGSLVTDCRIEEGTYSIHCSDAVEGIRIEENLAVGPSRFGVYCTAGASPLVRANSIIESRDCGIYTSASGPTCENNLIVRSVNWGVACFSFPEPALSCNGIFASGQGPYLGCESGTDDVTDDPLICDEVTYALSPESPYLNPPCGRIGAVGACE